MVPECIAVLIRNLILHTWLLQGFLLGCRNGQGFTNWHIQHVKQVFIDENSDHLLSMPNAKNWLMLEKWEVFNISRMVKIFETLSIISWKGWEIQWGLWGFTTIMDEAQPRTRMCAVGLILAWRRTESCTWNLGICVEWTFYVRWWLDGQMGLLANCTRCINGVCFLNSNHFIPNYEFIYRTRTVLSKIVFFGVFKSRSLHLAIAPGTGTCIIWT